MRSEEVVIPAGTRFPETPAYAVIPAGARVGVVVIHEVFGRQPEIDRVVHRFAEAGYAAVAPDLFAAPSRFTCLRHTVQAMRTGRGPAVAQASAVRSWLCERAGLAPAQVGIIGFCFGGGFALAVGAGWGAVSTNYGPVPAVRALRGLGPTIACYGAKDRWFEATPEVARRRLAAAGVAHEVHVFPDVGHSFLTDGHHPLAAFVSRPFLRMGHGAEVAEEAWAKILGFFAQALRSPQD